MSELIFCGILDALYLSKAMEDIATQLGSLCRFCMHDFWLLFQLHRSERWHQTIGVGITYTASILIFILYAITLCDCSPALCVYHWG